MESYMRIKFKGKKLRKLVISKEMGKSDLAIVTAKEYRQTEGIQNLVVDIDVKSIGGISMFKDLLDKISIHT
jgi:hypothetical protein